MGRYLINKIYKFFIKMMINFSQFSYRIRDMSYEKFKANTQLIKSITNQLTGYLRLQEFIFIFPRPDFRSRGDILAFEPQLYIIRPLTPPQARFSMQASQMPIINTLNRNKGYAHYQLFSVADTINVNDAIIQSMRDIALEDIFKRMNLSLNFIQFNSSSVVFQIKDRIKSNVPFTLWSPSIGLYELGYFASFEPKVTKFLNRVDVRFTYNEIRTFSSAKLDKV